MRTPFSREEIQKAETEEASQQRNAENYGRCSFCNSKLIFTHDLNLGYLEVVETGKCPGCGVAMNPKKFTLH